MLDYSLILLFLLFCMWIYFLSEYISNRIELVLGLAQFFIMIPLVILISSLSWIYSTPFGYVVVFVILSVSIALLADSYFRK